MPLTKLAEEMNVAIIFIQHINKNERGQNALHRTLGSIAFGAVARSVVLIAEDHDDPERKLFLPMKNNLARPKKGFAYRLVETVSGIAAIEWENDPVDISANDALAKLPDSTPRDEAADWLEAALANGPVEASLLMAQGEVYGHKKRTLIRAKDHLGIKPHKAKGGKFSGSWLWELPGDNTSKTRKAG